MAPFHPRREDLPEVFPIFPLAGALLLPRGRLPLNIFEPRYLALTEDSLAAGRMFGMIQPDLARPEGPSGPATFRVGCLGRLSSFSETDDGRYLISLAGLIRFRVAEEKEMRRGYRRIRADYAGFEDDLAARERPIGIGRSRRASARSASAATICCTSCGAISRAAGSMRTGRRSRRCRTTCWS